MASATDDPTNVASDEAVVVETATVSEAPAEVAAPEESVEELAPAEEPIPDPIPEPVTEAAPVVQEALVAPQTAPVKDKTVWTPQSVVTLEVKECFAEGQQPPLIYPGADWNIAPGESIVGLTYNGQSFGDREVRVNSDGLQTFEYTIRNDATGETQTLTGTFPVEACDTTPWVPTSTLTLSASECAADGQTVVITPTPNNTQGEAVIDLLVDGQPAPEVITAGVGTHTYQYRVLNLVTEAKSPLSQVFTFVVKPCDAPAAKYRLVLWQVVDSDGNGDIWEQKLVASKLTDSTDLGQLDGAATQCGTYQVDLYKNSKTTDSLVAGGVLYGPGNPTEDFPKINGPTYKVFEVTECDVVIAVPGMPDYDDACGPDNIRWTSVPESTDQVTWTLNEDGSLTVTPNKGFKFEGSEQSVTYRLPADSNKPCPVEPTPTPVTPEPTQPATPEEPKPTPASVPTGANEDDGDGSRDQGAEPWVVGLLSLMGGGLLTAGVFGLRRRRARA